jgi:predicted HTH domain antitoxin
MTTITIQCPDSVLISLKEDPDSFQRDVALAAAMKFYELGRLSSGRAADLAGLSRIEFLRRASDFKVPAWNLTDDELREDLRNA